MKSNDPLVNHRRIRGKESSQKTEGWKVWKQVADAIERGDNVNLLLLVSIRAAPIRNYADAEICTFAPFEAEPSIVRGDDTYRLSDPRVCVLDLPKCLCREMRDNRETAMLHNCLCPLQSRRITLDCWLRSLLAWARGRIL